MFLKNHSNIENLLNYKKLNISDFEIISITRHPYEKALSCARWSLVKHKYLKEGIKTVPSPDEIIQSLIANYKSGRLRSINNWPIYTFKGKYIVRGGSLCFISLKVKQLMWLRSNLKFMRIYGGNHI